MPVVVKSQKTGVIVREEEVWKLSVAGYTQYQIADQTGLNQGTVSRILNRIYDRKREQISKGLDQFKIDQTGKLEYVYSESMEAWRKSKTPRKRAVSKNTGDGDGEAQEMREAVERDGDTSFMYAGMAALKDIRSIWGLDVAPALQDTDTLITSISVDMTSRAGVYEEAAESPALDPPQPDRADPPGTGEVPQ